MNLLQKLIANSKFELINTDPYPVKRYSVTKPVTNKDRKKLITSYKVYNIQLQDIITANNKSIERLQNEMT